MTTGATEKKAEHTPTPWDSADNTLNIYVKDETGQDIYLGTLHGFGLPNRQFVKLAVNNFDELVDASRSALDILPHVVKFLKFQSAGREFWPNREAGEAAISRLESVLAKAQVKP